MARVKADWACLKKECGARGTRAAITEEVADFRAKLAQNDHTAAFHPKSLINADGLPNKDGPYDFTVPDDELLRGTC